MMMNDMLFSAMILAAQISNGSAETLLRRRLAGVPVGPTACLTEVECRDRFTAMHTAGILTGYFYASGNFPTKGCVLKGESVYFGSGGTLEEMSSFLTAKKERLWCESTPVELDVSMSMGLTDMSIPLETSEMSMSMGLTDMSVPMEPSEMSMSKGTTDMSVPLGTSEMSMSIRMTDMSVLLETSEMIMSIGMTNMETSLSMGMTEMAVPLETSEMNMPEASVSPSSAPPEETANATDTNPVTGFFENINLTSATDAVTDPVTDFFDNITLPFVNFSSGDDATKESATAPGAVALSTWSHIACFISVACYLLIDGGQFS